MCSYLIRSLSSKFAAYNYRGFDIAMHFYQRTHDVSNMKNKFKSDVPFPNAEERRHFIRAYLEEMKVLNKFELDESDDGLDNVENIVMEADYFIMADHLFGFLMMLKGTFAKAGLGKIFSFIVSCNLFLSHLLCNCKS